MRFFLFTLLGFFAGLYLSWPGILIPGNWKCFNEIIAKSADYKVSFKAALEISPSYLLNGKSKKTSSKIRIVAEPRAVDVRVVARLGLVLDVGGRDGDTTPTLFRSVVDGIEGAPVATEHLGGNASECRSQRGLAVVDVTDGADVDMRFGTLKFFLSHCYNLFTLANG